jgi:hypothetical protein
VPGKATFGALAAKRAFERTDPGIERVGRQIPIAAFAIRPEFEHRHPISIVRRFRIVREKVGIGERLSL